jgi:hypothetical protein
MTEELEQLLKNLKLKRILEIYDEQLRAADKDDISYSDFVTRLVRAQLQAKQEGALEWRIRRANLPERWTLETFPFARQPGVNRKQIRDLSAINRPKAAVPLARRRLSGEGGILFQLRLPLGGEGSARVSIWQGPPGHSPQGHDSIYLTFGRTEQPRSRLGRTRWRCDPSPLPCLSARFDHRAWPPAQTVA